MLSKVYRKLKGTPRPETMEETIERYRKNGVTIGENCHIYSPISNIRDQFLLTIGNNVTVSTNVKFLMHDNAISKPSNEKFTDILGKVTIGNNCFIGYGSIILPGVSIADNCIIGAGSVVTRSIKEEGSVYAGNPAKYVCKTQDYYEKNKDNAMNLDNMTMADIQKAVQENPSLLKSR